MAPNYSSLHEKLLGKISAALPKASSKKTREFVREFYALSTVHDLEELSPARAVAIAQACEDFYASRPKAGPKIHTARVTVDEAGRKLTRTQVMVLNDDMPFLVDSLSALVSSLGLTIHRVLHPTFLHARDAKGALSANGKARTRESLIYIELSPLPATLSEADLSKRIAHALRHVSVAVTDWASMRERVLVMAEQFTGEKTGIAKADSEEIRDLLLWLAGNHFVFLGLADYRQKGAQLVCDTASALGIYRLEPTNVSTIERAGKPTSSETLSVLKASDFSCVHRHALMDFITVKRFDAKGKFIGETRMLGLFTSTVYYRETQNIPFIRRKAARVMERAGFDPKGHSGKTLKTILEFMPRDELFQMDEERLFQTAMGIVSLEAKPQVKLFVRHDPFARFVSAMIYVPRERFSTDLRDEVMRMTEQAYGGRTSSFYTQLTDSPLARLHMFIETTAGNVATVDEAALEQQIITRTNIWADSLRDAMQATQHGEDGETLAQCFAEAFPLSYINSFTAQVAASDITKVQECLNGDGIALELLRAVGAPANQLHLKCFTRDLNSELSAIIPLLEHMGCTVIDATPYVITPLSPYAPVLLRNFTLRVNGVEQLDLREHGPRIEAAIGDIWRGLVDNDALNALVFVAGLSARDVLILRAYSRYLQQLNFPYSQGLIASALTSIYIGASGARSAPFTQLNVGAS
jgi:glutamate dehydrogenase